MYKTIADILNGLSFNNIECSVVILLLFLFLFFVVVVVVVFVFVLLLLYKQPADPQQADKSGLTAILGACSLLCRANKYFRKFFKFIVRLKIILISLSLFSV